MEYTLSLWEYLAGCCDLSYLNISSAKAENAIRPFAVSRKVWLFADSTQGACTRATCYTLIETAKANQLEPYTYINYVKIAEDLGVKPRMGDAKARTCCRRGN